MRLLLDTHIVQWTVTSPGKLSADERRFLDREHELHVSAATLWEVRLKWQSYHPSGDRKGEIDPERLLDGIRRSPMRLLELTPEHAATPLDTPIAHKDPFDELLLAQAQVEGMRLLTRDRLLAGHPLTVRPG